MNKYLYACCALLVIVHLSSCGHSAYVYGRGGAPEAVSPAAPVPAKSDAAEVAPAEDASAPAEDASERQVMADQKRIQAGILTAGSFDDNLHLPVFHHFISQMQQTDKNRTLSQIRLGQRILITVHNRAGAPVGNARLRLWNAEQQEVITLITGSDGRALLATGWDQLADDQQFELQVKTLTGEHARQRFSTQKNSWDVVIDSPAALPNQLDLAFVVDTTGSMGDELEFLKMETANIVHKLQRKFPQVDIRCALIVYRDRGDDYVTQTFDFSTLPAFQKDLAQQEADGGGDYPEAMDKALAEAAELNWRAQNTARVLFLLADAPPHTPDIAATFKQVNALRLMGVKIYPVAASGVADMAEFVMRVAAWLTLSEYIFITDDSGVGNPHAKPRIPGYHVQKLNVLMMRLIASELAGKKIPPDPQHIIKTVGQPTEF